MLARRSSGAAGLFCLQEVGTEERALRPKGRQNPPASQGGAAGALRAHKAWAGANGPRPCFGFVGPSGPQNAAAPPRVTLRQPTSLTPALLRQPYGGRPEVWGKEARKRARI